MRAPDTAGRSAPAERGLRQAVSALRHRNYAWFWTGALISNCGTWMQNVTIPFVLLYVMHTGAVWVGIATLALVLPQMLLGPFAGSFADRFPRKRVIIVSQSVQAVLALVMWAVWIGGVRKPAVYIGLVALIGMANALNMPAWQAFITELVPRSDLLNAVTLNSAQFNAARAVGPALGGLVLARFGPSWAFLVNALSFVAVVGALLFVRVAAVVNNTVREPVMREFREGYRYARAHAGIAVPIVVAMLVGLIALPVSQVAPIMANKVFDLDAGHYGVLLGCYGGGAVLAAVGMGVIGASIHRSRLVLFWVIVFAGGLTVFGAAPGFLTAVVGLALCGACFLGIYAILNTTVQLHVPERLRGRVLAVYVMSFSGTFPLGSFVQSWLAGVVGARQVVLGTAVLTAVMAVVLIARPRYLHAMDGELESAGEPVVDPLIPVESAAPAIAEA
jgi:MFS family permease